MLTYLWIFNAIVLFFVNFFGGCGLNCLELWGYRMRLLFCWCFSALRHILGHFGRGQLTYPHCSWANLLGSLPVFSAHSFASNWQLPFLNQRKEENGRRNYFMTKLQNEVFMDKVKEISSKSKSDQRKCENWHIISENNIHFRIARAMIAKCKKRSPKSTPHSKNKMIFYTPCARWYDFMYSINLNRNQNTYHFRLFIMGAVSLFQKACDVSNGKPALPSATRCKHWPAF